MSDPKFPVPGMTVMPYGLPLMSDAWLDCVVWASGVPAIVGAFTEETGLTVDWLAGRDPISQMIDKAVGRDRQLFAAWCDWVTKNYWGVEDDE